MTLIAFGEHEAPEGAVRLFGGSTRRESVASHGSGVRLPIGAVRPRQLVRLGEVRASHLEAMLELGGAWPPLVVTPAGEIVDGHYRYLAARRLGHSHIDCIVFDGDGCEAFVEGVRRNVQNGLPLTLRERKAAACRILTFQPQWSDRRIAAICGLAHETVGRLRKSPTCQDGDFRHLDSGRKPRDVTTAETRERVREALAANPLASLRQVARLAGTTHETVRAVRRRTEIPCSPQSDRRPATSQGESFSVVSPSRDAAFTSTIDGTRFAGWFERASIGAEWQEYVSSVPLSRVYEIADAARQQATHWTNFAAALAARVPSHS